MSTPGTVRMPHLKEPVGRPRRDPPHCVVVTRDEPPDGPLSAELRSYGLEVLAWPVLAVSPPEDARPLDEALGRAQEFQWIAFASRHGVAAVTQRLPRQPSGTRIGAVGPSTAEALREAGWSVDVVPEVRTAAALVTALTGQVVAGHRVLLPSSSRALPTLRDGLMRLGADVLQVEAYHTDAAPLDLSTCRALIERSAVGAVTFTSPSAVTELEHALGPVLFERLLSAASAISLGATTGRTLAHRGCVSVLAEPSSLAGLAATTFQILQLRP